MQLRPLAPLAVIGAGLLAMSLATHSASADENGAPEAVDVASVAGGLAVTWSSPSGSGSVSDYDVTVMGPDGRQIFDREIAADVTSLRLSTADLAGATDLTVVVAAEYGAGERAASDRIRVTLPAGPAKPAVAPAVRASGRLLKVVLPETPDGVTGRIVQLYRDGAVWATVPVGDGEAVVTRKVTTGHGYAVAYQDLNAVGAGAPSDRSAEVAVRSAAGPGAVAHIKMLAVDGGLKVKWSGASVESAALAHYQVRLVKDGQRVGTAVTAADLHSVVVPSAVVDGVYDVTITAVDADGRTSTSAAAITPRQ